jgi:hypothetical protein
VSETLKPCPFCGGDAWHDEDGVVVCAGCGAMGPEINSIHRDDNAAAWNRRASPVRGEDADVSEWDGTTWARALEAARDDMMWDDDYDPATVAHVMTCCAAKLRALTREPPSSSDTLAEARREAQEAREEVTRMVQERAAQGEIMRPTSSRCPDGGGDLLPPTKDDVLGILALVDRHGNQKAMNAMTRIINAVAPKDPEDPAWNRVYESTPEDVPRLDLGENEGSYAFGPGAPEKLFMDHPAGGTLLFCPDGGGEPFCYCAACHTKHRINAPCATPDSQGGVSQEMASALGQHDPRARSASSSEDVEVSMALASLYDVATELRDEGDHCRAAALYMAWGSLHRVPPESAPEPELVDIYMALDWRPAFWRQVEFAWLPEDEVFLTRWISARTCGLKGQGGDVASAVSDLMEATALYLRVMGRPAEPTQEPVAHGTIPGLGPMLRKLQEIADGDTFATLTLSPTVARSLLNYLRCASPALDQEPERYAVYQDTTMLAANLTPCDRPLPVGITIVRLGASEPTGGDNA